MDPPDERLRRWRLVLGGDDDEPLSEQDRRMDAALEALYNRTPQNRRGGLGGSAPRVARWLGDIREFFPTPVVQVIQRDALDRLGLKSMLLEPELLATFEADVHLVADLIALRSAIPERSRETARQVVRKVVDDLLALFAQAMDQAVRGAINRSRRTRRPRPRDIDWDRTIRANLRHWQPEHRTVVPARLLGHTRQAPARADLDEVIVCVDQSGSMASSVVYASIFAAVMASLPVIQTRLVCFDTAVVDLTEDLADPVDVLFGVQLGGGTDIARALAYCQGLVARPAQTHLVLITDLYEGGQAGEMLRIAADLVTSGVNVIVLLALSDDGRPAYDASNASGLADVGCPVFACTPGEFPALMATALRRGDIHSWAAERGLVTTRAGAGARHLE